MWRFHAVGFTDWKSDLYSASFPLSFDFYNVLVLRNKNLLLFLFPVFFHQLTIFVSKHLQIDAEMTIVFNFVLDPGETQVQIKT